MPATGAVAPVNTEQRCPVASSIAQGGVVSRLTALRGSVGNGSVMVSTMTFRDHGLDGTGEFFLIAHDLLKARVKNGVARGAAPGIRPRGRSRRRGRTLAGGFIGDLDAIAQAFGAKPSQQPDLRSRTTGSAAKAIDTIVATSPKITASAILTFRDMETPMKKRARLRVQPGARQVEIR